MNPLPYFTVDHRKRSDGRFRIYIRQNTKPATVIPTDFFLKSKADFKKGFPKDVVLKNSCLAILKKLEDIEKKVGGASTLGECWDIMKTKPTKSEFVVDWIVKPNRFQLKEFNPKLKFSELTRDNLSAYLQHLKAKVKDTTVGNHIAELKRVAKSAKRYFDVPEDLFAFKPKLKQSLPREPLNWIELMKLYRLPVDPALDMFLFECFTGIRYSDLTDDLRVNDNHIVLIQRKTGKISAPALNPLAKSILQRNSVRTIDGALQFSAHRRAIQTINRRLKTIAEKHGINKNLSTHIGRHSFAKLLSDLGIPENIRAIQLGHSPISNTQIYGRSTDYEFASRFVLMAFKRAMESKAVTYEDWLMDINPTFRDIYSKAI
jgi:integrase